MDTTQTHADSCHIVVLRGAALFKLNVVDPTCVLVGCGLVVSCTSCLLYPRTMRYGRAVVVSSAC